MTQPSAISRLPSMAEALTAEHGEKWEIWRELTGNRHGDWFARRWSSSEPEHRAPTIEGLAHLLAGGDDHLSSTT